MMKKIPHARRARLECNRFAPNRAAFESISRDLFR
jgi:hypothetical protein